MTTGRINQIATSTDRMSSLKLSQPVATGMQDPPDTNHKRCAARTNVPGAFSVSIVCVWTKMFVSVPIDNSARRDSKGCPSERSHKELPRIHGPTFPYTFKQRRTKRTKPEPEHVGLGKRELGKVPPLLARPTTSRSGAPGATLSLHARPPRPGNSKSAYLDDRSRATCADSFQPNY